MLFLPVCFAAFLSLFYLSIPQSPQIFGKAIHSVKTKEKVVALTFDDGPNQPYTNELLKILKEQDVVATFFIVGQCAAKYPELVKKIYREGHELGNHSWSHKMLIGHSPTSVRRQITKTDDLLRDLGYEGEIHFRSPHGMKLFILPRVLSSMKKKNILFDVIPWDWTNPGTKKIVRRVLRAVRPGAIVLLHDGGGDRSQTVAATKQIVPVLKSRGYRFVTISQLLALRRSQLHK